MVSILAFSVDSYAKEEIQLKDGFMEYKNLVALDDMSPKQLYETALDDEEYVVIYDDLQSFLNDINGGFISSEGYYFYQYSA